MDEIDYLMATFFILGFLTASTISMMIPEPTDNVVYRPDSTALSSKNVTYTGDFMQGSYHINFTHHIAEDLEIEATGRALNVMEDPEIKKIKVKPGRPAKQVRETICHEVIHHEFNFAHKKPPSKDPLNKLDNNFNMRLCDNAVKKALKLQ